MILITDKSLKVVCMLLLRETLMILEVDHFLTSDIFVNSPFENHFEVSIVDKVIRPRMIGRTPVGSTEVNEFNVKKRSSSKGEGGSAIWRQNNVPAIKTES